jgi:hypothetical protein
MGKQVFTMVNVISYEVDEEAMDNANNFKDAFNNGDIKIAEHNVVLFNPDGTIYDNEEDISIIKNAIVYGLVEKG